MSVTELVQSPIGERIQELKRATAIDLEVFKRDARTVDVTYLRRQVENYVDFRDKRAHQGLIAKVADPYRNVIANFMHIDFVAAVQRRQ